jgi:hypothetical protein
MPVRFGKGVGGSFFVFVTDKTSQNGSKAQGLARSPVQEEPQGENGKTLDQVLCRVSNGSSRHSRLGAFAAPRNDGKWIRRRKRNTNDQNKGEMPWTSP